LVDRIPLDGLPGELAVEAAVDLVGYRRLNVNPEDEHDQCFLLVEPRIADEHHYRAQADGLAG
jgi:hypothetical protein